MKPTGSDAEVPCVITQIVRVTAAEVRPIRGAVLRPGQAAERLVYPGDNDSSSVHLAWRDTDGRVVSAVSLYDEPLPGTDAPAWRIRGMATLPEYRSRGLGGELLRRCFAHVRGVRPGTVWCNARTSAAGYYAKHGFEQLGETFEIPDIGEHVVMVLNLSESAG